MPDLSAIFHPGTGPGVATPLLLPLLLLWLQCCKPATLIAATACSYVCDSGTSSKTWKTLTLRT